MGRSEIMEHHRIMLWRPGNKADGDLEGPTDRCLAAVGSEFY